MVNKKTLQTENAPSLHNIPMQQALDNNSLVCNYKSLSFFLERTSETIRKTTVMIQQLESEVARLRYEVMATENEYKNLKHVAEDLELKVRKFQASTKVDNL